MKRFYAETPLWADGINIGIAEEGRAGDGQRQTSVVRLTLETIAEGGYTEPTMRLTRSEAAELLDALWRVGVRPSNGEGNAGQLGATEKHLEDMRRLVFDERPK